jgi:TonB-dependent SusC/RagA subfamily outer membrane receptor
MRWNKFLLMIIIVSLSVSVYGQDPSKKSEKPITISGTVLNIQNKPVAGADLYVDNTKADNTTKNDGSYKIKVNSSALRIEVRSTEFGSCSSEIGGQTIINFILDNSGGRVLKPGELAKIERSQDSIKKADMKAKRINSYNDIYQMIRGEVTGVIVSGRSIQVQQGHSFIGSSTPLFVVNGVIVQSIDYINPVEVKSITVLKGSAASIYGVNGTNGVINITLKNGTDK